ncbi:hypothetical protein AB0P15_01890 [Streptomyces sp. NPDC087917]|uniref:hypothetical protein n=1 Tax=unclassified Streptomyces TaxID=2593676 RepID=UPI00344AC853
MRATRILEWFPAGGPHGSRPAEEYAAQRTARGQAVTVVMCLERDAFLVVACDHEPAASAA